MSLVEDRIRNRLGDLSSRLGGADRIDGAFSAGDLLMAAVLRRLQGSGKLEEYPNLAAYVVRSGLEAVIALPRNLIGPDPCGRKAK